jgi:hypothetical protein
MNVPKLTNYSTDIYYSIMINHSFIIIIISAQPNRNYSFSTTNALRKELHVLFGHHKQWALL